MFSFEWALTHRSFPRILPDSSYSPGVILKSSKVWRKYELSLVKCLSPRSFKFFSSSFNLSNFHLGVSQQFMVVFSSVFLNIWRPKKNFSSILSILSDTRGSSLMPSSHNWFRLWEFFYSVRSNSRVFSVWLSRVHQFRFIHSSFQLPYSKS